jgi:hypothetical protein
MKFRGSTIIKIIFVSMPAWLVGCTSSTPLQNDSSIEMPVVEAIQYLNNQSHHIKQLVHTVTNLTPTEGIHYSSVFSNRESSCTFHKEYVEYHYNYSWKRGTEKYEYSAISLIQEKSYIKETVLLIQIGNSPASLADARYLPRRCMIFYSSDNPLVNDSEIQRFISIKSALHALGVTRLKIL